MKNELVARVLYMIADLEEIKGEEAFKAGSYRKAASYIYKMSQSIEDMARAGTLLEIPGVGKNISAKIEEIIAKGTASRLERLLSEVPPELLDLLLVPGLGPRTAARLYRELGIRGPGDLDAALRDGSVAALKGFGDKKAASLAKGLRELSSQQRRFLLSYAWPVALQILKYLQACVPEGRYSVAGSIRRMKESVKDIDLVAAVPEQSAAKIADCFTQISGISEVLAKGTTKCSVRLEGGVQVDLRIVEPEQYATALHHFTGSKEHHVEMRALAKDLGYKINEYGVFRAESGDPVAIQDEASLYSLLGLDYVPPEIREGTGEVTAAKSRTLPHLVNLSDVRGDLHLHTNWSDGLDTIAEMADAAKARGYEYIAVTDHSKALAFAGGLDEKRLLEQASVIDRLNRDNQGFRVLKGIEVDILSDGRLDLADEVLSQCDIVVASIHSGFRQDEAQIFRRLEAACHNPHVDIIGHLTGRIIAHRSPYAVDTRKVLQVARDTNTALEINSSPDRLDISSQVAREAREMGVKCSISTDAHSRRGLADMIYGIGVARRGWLEPSDVLNAMPCDRLLEMVRK